MTSPRAPDSSNANLEFRFVDSVHPHSALAKRELVVRRGWPDEMPGAGQSLRDWCREGVRCFSGGAGNFQADPALGLPPRAAPAAVRIGPRRVAPVDASASGSRSDPRLKTGGGLHLLIAGHDLRFLDSIRGHARASGAQIREDVWSGHDQHSESASGELLGWADTVFCEWCLGNAVWYSRNMQPNRRLIVRFHRQERETDFPASVAIDRVDRVVFVARHLLEEAAQRYSWPEEKLLVVPNAVDLEALGREKLAWGRFNLALIGYVPQRKRLAPRPGPTRAPARSGSAVPIDSQGTTPMAVRVAMAARTRAALLPGAVPQDPPHAPPA